jgi:hypothetical protein
MSGAWMPAKIFAADERVDGSRGRQLMASSIIEAARNIRPTGQKGLMQSYVQEPRTIVGVDFREPLHHIISAAQQVTKIIVGFAVQNSKTFVTRKDFMQIDSNWPQISLTFCSQNKDNLIVKVLQLQQTKRNWAQLAGNAK